MGGVFKGRRRGGVEILLSPYHRQIISELFEEAAALCNAGAKEVWRIFPPKFSDPTLEAEESIKGALRGQDVHQERAQLFIDMAQTLRDGGKLDNEATQFLLMGLNQLRLIVGEIIGITADSNEPQKDAGEGEIALWNTYHFTGDLVMELLSEISATPLEE